MRLGAAFIALCMVIVAGSVGAALYLALGLTSVEAMVVAVAVLAALAVYNTAAARMRDRGDPAEQIADLSQGTADLARQVGELGRRVISAEALAHAASDRVAGATQPLAAEIGELGALIKRLAETVAAHEAKLSQAAQPPGSPAVAAASDAPVGKGSDDVVQRSPAGPFKGMDAHAIQALIRSALDDNRIELYLQPIVTLPQRKVRYYEATPRLRTPEGVVLAPEEFLSFAAEGGLMPRLDNMLLFRCVQVVRRLTARNREIGLFCNLSSATLVDAEFFPQLSDFMQANRALAPSLVLEFGHGALRAMGPLEFESLASFAELGFRFSLDHLADLRIEPRDIAERGFRFVKAPGWLLLNRIGVSPDIDPADFSNLLGRFGIELIAERIESEGTVVDLLDYDVRFAQGTLFAPPRPVRADALQDIGEPAGAAREPSGAATPVAPADAEAAQPAAINGTPASAETPEPRPPEGRVSVLAQLARGMARRAAPG
jgi:cyclic-di-GMP phosphodiesterase, flagellum assembly factor TipF